MNKPIKLLKQLNKNNYIIIQRLNYQLDIFYSFWIDDAKKKPPFLTIYFDNTNHYTVNGYGATATNPESVFSQVLEAVKTIVADERLLSQLNIAFRVNN